MRRAVVPLAVAAALMPGAAPASAAPVVVDTGYAQRDPVRPRTATAVCVAVAAGASAVAITECGFEGEESTPGVLASQAMAVATFTGLIGEQPKTLCWKGYAVAPGTVEPVPFDGCVVVS